MLALTYITIGWADGLNAFSGVIYVLSHCILYIRCCGYKTENHTKGQSSQTEEWIK